ncbi:preprotein translocase subunit SecG [Balneatrix alpica]|uniref:preprotein translocase subunit SecG n=1 Tax=Balneatrix alpica TaxID=75684 RepID=UPI00273A322A|nr:preprotein translocase subunit SecG [Balneatrix alpica]
METLILVVHFALAIAFIALVLLQQGKGADAGAAFGSGASQTVFGSQGSGSFLGKLSAAIAAGLFLTSFVLAIYAKQKVTKVQDAGVPAAQVIEQQVQEQAALPDLDQPQKTDQ